MTPEQFDRLPKYAQRRIEKLQRDVVYYQKKAEVEMAGGMTDTFIRRYDLSGISGYEYMGLARGETLWFPNEGSERDGITVEVTRYGGGYVPKGALVAQAEGNTLLHIIPLNSTQVELRAVRRA